MEEKFIIDALTIRDFDRIGLLKEISKLNFHISTTSAACDRNLYPPGIFSDNTFANHKIRIRYLSPDEQMEACTLGFSYPGIMYEDHTVLHLAQSEKCSLITSDPCITKAAVELGVFVCNYVWLLLSLSETGIITSNQAWMKHLELTKNVSPIALSKMSHDFLAEASIYKNQPA